MYDFAKARFRHARIVPMESQVDAIKALASGGFDAALLSKLQAQHILYKLGVDNIKPVGPPIEPRKYCFAVPEGRSELLAQLNEGLSILKQTGAYDAIHEKWFGVYEEKSLLREMLRYALWILTPLFGLLVASFAWTWSLRRKVSQKTQALNHELAERRRAEARYRGIFENIMDGFYRADLQGRILLASPSAVQMLGYDDFEQLAGANIAEQLYASPEERTVLERRLAEKGEVRGFLVSLKRKDGAVLLVEANSKIVRDPETGEAVAIEGVFRDVTERTRLEEIIIQSEKMSTIGRMAAGMAHEINNPLAAILASVQNILRRLSPSLPANLRAAEASGVSLDAARAYLEERKIFEMLRIIEESGSRAAGIVTGMLGFSRKQDSSRKDCDINRLIDESIALASSDFDFKKGYDFKQIEIVKQYASDLPEASCIRGEMEQVMVNLLQNAAQAMAGQRVKRYPPRIEIITRREAEHIVISVADNGPGIDESVRRKLFEPFFTTKPPGQGTGLGLAVSYFLVNHNHGGDIQAASEPGKGATSVTPLPLRPSSKSVESHESP